MDYYQDIRIFPDNEIDVAFLRNKIYTKLHKAIFDLNVNDIGVSFPQAEKKLGCIIRVHSTQSRLTELQNLNWLGGLFGYCKMSDILSVPKNIKGHQTISRIRRNMSIVKMQQKIAYQQSKGYITTDKEIVAYEKHYKAKMFATGLGNPYLELQSTSTDNKYRLYIQFGGLQNKEVVGAFNRFGLSNTTTVPIF